MKWIVLAVLLAIVWVLWRRSTASAAPSRTGLLARVRNPSEPLPSLSDATSPASPDSSPASAAAGPRKNA